MVSIEERAVAAFREIVSGDELWRTMTDLTVLVCVKLAVPVDDLTDDYDTVRDAINDEALGSDDISWALYVRLDPDVAVPEATAGDDVWGWNAYEAPAFNRVLALLRDGRWHDVDEVFTLAQVINDPDDDRDFEGGLYEMFDEGGGGFQAEHRVRLRGLIPIYEMAMRKAPDVLRGILGDGEWHQDTELHRALADAVAGEASRWATEGFILDGEEYEQETRWRLSEQTAEPPVQAWPNWCAPIYEAARRVAPDVLPPLIDDNEWLHEWEAHVVLHMATMREGAWKSLDHKAAEVEGERLVKLGEYDDFDDYQQFAEWEAIQDALVEFLSSRCTSTTRYRVSRPVRADEPQSNLWYHPEQREGWLGPLRLARTP